MAYSPQFGRTTTLAADMSISETTSATLASAVFTNFTTDYLVLDYDVPSKREVIKCTVTAGAISSITRSQDGTSAVAHSQGAKVGYNFVPRHYTDIIPVVIATDGGTAGDFTTSSSSFTDVTLGSTTYTNNTNSTQTVVVRGEAPIGNDTAAKITYLSLTATGTGVTVPVAGRARVTSTTFVTLPVSMVATVTAGNTMTIKFQIACDGTGGTARIGMNATDTKWKITGLAFMS